MAFLSQQFHYNKKTSCSASGGAVVLVLLCQLTLELIMLLTTQRYRGTLTKKETAFKPSKTEIL